VDAGVLIAGNLSSAKQAVKEALRSIDAVVLSESDASIRATRRQHVNLLYGEGGELIRVTFTSVASDRTFITIATQRPGGNMAQIGSRGWSKDLIDRIVQSSKTP
jgi:hypothetical protein